MNELGEWLKKWWFLLVALVSMSVAWGDTTQKITTVEEAVKATATTQQQVAKLEERTNLMLDQQKEMNQLLQRILLGQRNKDNVNKQK